MLRHRLVFGALMIGLLIGALFVDERLDQLDIEGAFLQSVFLGRTYLPAGLVMLGIVLVIVALAARELGGMLAARGVAIDRFMLWLAATIGLLLAYVIPHDLDSEPTIAIYASFLAGLFILTLVRFAWRKRTNGAMAAAGAVMFAFVYLGVLPGFYLAIRRWHSAWVIVAIILIVKSCDIGAYFTGRAIGRHKLIPWLSPGKTWEGLIGGVIFAGAVAAALAALGEAAGVLGRYGVGRQFVDYSLPLWYAALAGVLLGAVGQIGDLVASMFKRDAGLKDSGRSIPGFGGVLDVVDSPILVAPLAYWLLVIAARLGS